jgi:molybdopterin converting factor small subunit
MARVVLTGALRAAAGGLAEIEVEASTFREVLDRLAEAQPDLRPLIERGVSLAIDGLIYREAWLTPIRADSEVVLMPYMTGG